MANFLKLKRRVNFILKNWVKYYTKEAFKLCKVASLGIIVIVGIVIIKYKPAYQVTISGETLTIPAFGCVILK